MVISWTTLYTLLQGLDVSCDYFLIAVVGFLAAMAMLIACNLKRERRLGQLVCFLFVMVLVGINWLGVLQGLFRLINLCIYQINAYYTTANLSYVVLDIEDSRSRETLLQIALLHLHALYTLILMVVNWKKMHPIFTILGPVLVIVFVLNIGVVPAPVALFLFLLTTFIMFMLHDSFQGDGMIAWRIESMGMAAVCVVVVAVTVISVVGQKGEQYDSATLSVWQSKINQFVNDMTWEDFANLFTSHGGGNDNSTDTKGIYNRQETIALGTKDSVEFSGQQVLSVWVPKGEERNYYFKNYMGNVYVDNSWTHETVSAVSAFMSSTDITLTETAESLQIAKELEVDNSSAIYETKLMVQTYLDGDFVVPEYMSNAEDVYGGSFDSEGYPVDVTVLGDILTFSVCGMETYGSVFSNGLPETMMGRAALWRDEDYPGDTYLAVPQNVQEAIEEKLGELCIQVNGESYVANQETGSALEAEYGLQPFIDYVTDYLGTMEYTLSPGACPEGEDFIINFLFESKKGYCMHFATAATLLFRQMGIPARYVSGYIVHDYDFNAGLGDDAAYSVANITDYKSHAWVEIYEEDLGWVPVEVTVGFGNDMERETETKEVQTTTQKQTQQTTKKKEVQTTTTTHAAKKTEETKTSLQLPWKWLGILLVVVLLTLLLWYGICCYGKRMRKPGRLSRNLVRMENRLYGILLEDGVHWDCTDSNRLLMEVTAQWGEAVAELLRQFQVLSDYHFYSETGIPYEKKLEMERLARTMLRIVKPKLSRKKQVIIHIIWCMD
jgi:hypothetical protein